MGQLRFSIPNIEDYDPRIWETAYITGIEGIPWRCFHELSACQFNIGREIEESGKLNIVWPTATAGNLCLSTTSLRIAKHSYALAVEVARGTVFRLKSQTHEWQKIGLKLPSEFFPLAEQSLDALLRSLVASADPVAQTELAQVAIDRGVEAMFQMGDAFSTQALEARRNSEGRLSTLLGVQLDQAVAVQSVAPAVQKAFNLAGVSADFGTVEANATQAKSSAKNYAAFDAQLEWLSSIDHKVCIGPLVDFREGALPDWLSFLDDGFESILQAACQHAARTVERYKGKATLWNCAAGINVPNRMRWSDEQVLRMAVSLIETVRKADDRSPVLLTVDQPWSEYLRSIDSGISPLHFADALIRADLGLNGLALELNFDCWPGGSFPRDPIEINRLIDRWSMLGLPLMVILSVPCRSAGNNATSSPTIGSENTPDQGTSASQWQSSGKGGSLAAESVVRLLASKPSVHAILWRQLSDQAAQNSKQPQLQDAGLWDAQGKPKQILGSLANLRATYLH